MKLSKDFLRSTDFGLLVLRLSLGCLMLFHGVAKLQYGFGWIDGMLAQVGLPGFISYGVLLGEVVAPVLLMLGVWTRLSSAVFIGNMVVAVLLAHVGDLCSINAATGGLTLELQYLYMLGALALCFTGGGKFAVTKSSVLD